MGLRIAPELELPLEAVTQTFGILAKRGVGKTYTASVMTEELLKAGLHTVVADPVGVWWGLRSSRDGAGPGLPIVVIGGEHGDLPLPEGDGALIADLVIDEGVSAVLDLSLFRKGQQVRFMTDFAERLYHRNREPLHLVLDEADAFAPQRPMKGHERLLGAMEDLVRRGRARGLGCTLITQRPAVLNKDVLTQVEVLVALRVIAPQDREAIDAWIRVRGTEEQRRELLASLASLPVGTAWFWSPGWLDLFRRVNVRERETFDSSATPKVGEVRPQPRVLAEVDIERLRDKLAATLERAASEDPAKLRQRIAELERELRKARSEGSAPEVRIVEVPVLDEDLARLLERIVTELTGVLEQIQGPAGELWQAVRRLRRPGSLDPGSELREQPAGREAQALARERRSPRPHEEATGPTPYARSLLETMATHHPVRLTRAQISTLSGRRPRSSAFQAAMAEIVRGRWARQVGDQYELTDEGLAMVGGTVPAARDPREVWLSALPGYERALLEVLLEAYPDLVTREELAGRTGRSITSSAFSGAISTLRRNGLAQVENGRVRASDTLFMGGM